MRNFEERFKPHVPNADQLKVIKLLEVEFLNLANLLDVNLPNGPEKVVALRKLLDAKMQATMAIFDTGTV